MNAANSVKRSSGELMRIPFHERVLVGTGANEVVRPYHNQWWIDM